MLGIALHGPNGENHHRWEFCEHATVGQLREWWVVALVGLHVAP